MTSPIIVLDHMLTIYICVCVCVCVCAYVYVCLHVHLLCFILLLYGTNEIKLYP